ncbi:hypothetical protein SUDANB1_07662 [Streptomyces sp. enrichment culture]
MSRRSLRITPRARVPSRTEYPLRRPPIATGSWAQRSGPRWRSGWVPGATAAKHRGQPKRSMRIRSTG